MRSTRASRHLLWSELACHDEERTPYPVEWRDSRLDMLTEVFEVLRHKLGGAPLQIGSAYRTPSWNRKQGGARRSQHVEGRALDIYPPKRMGMKTFHRLAREHANQDAWVGGFGYYVWGIHIDVRPGHGKLVVWNQLPAGTRMHDTRV